MTITNITTGNSSLLCDIGNRSILYEKLANTIRSGERDALSDLQAKIEAVSYSPSFETESLKKERNRSLGVLLFEVTEQCNLGCSYCIYSGNYVGERTATNKRLSFDVAQKALNEMAPLSNGGLMVGFYGGEPLLEMPLIKDIMTYSRREFPSIDFAFSMTSNFLNGDRWFRDIVDNGMYVNISLDGPAHVHDKFRRTRGGKPTHKKIISNLAQVEEYSPGYTKSHFFILSTCHDPNDLEDIVDFFEGSELFVSHINKTEDKGRIIGKIPKSEKGSDLSEEYRERISRGQDPAVLRRLFDGDLKTVAVRDEEIMPETLMLNGSCYPSKRRVFVDVNGLYHPCERFGSRLVIGSVNEGLQQSVIEEDIDEFAEIRNNLCSNCWAQRLCTPCLQHAKDPAGEISVEGLSQTCETRRGQILTGLDNYIRLMEMDAAKTKEYIEGINPLFERGFKKNG